MNEDTKGTNNTEAALRFAKRHTKPRVLDVEAPDGSTQQVLLTTGGDGGTEISTIDSLFSEFRPAPLRRKGTIDAHDVASFCELVNRDARPESVIFADVASRHVCAVLDFHGAIDDVGDKVPAWCDDRISYRFKLSEQLQAWMVAGQGPMNQRDFARLIDDRLNDVGDPSALAPDSVAAIFAARRGIRFATATDLAVFTRQIVAKSANEAQEFYDENTGSSSVQYVKKNDVKTPDGAPVVVPAAFVLSIPILRGIGATVYNIAVRLRYDIGDRGIAWRVELHALDTYVSAAAEESLKVIRDECKLPVYLAAVPPAAS